MIGNDDYQHADRLLNARTDAKAVTEALRAIRFKVTLKQDLTLQMMKDTIRAFKDTVSGGDEVIFYYSGHGVQLDGENFLIPVDTRGESAGEIKDDSISLQSFLTGMQYQKARFTLAIVDACRNNPFKDNGRALRTRGLATVDPADGQAVLYSAGAGQEALDNLGAGDSNPNGVFTRVLIREMSVPGRDFDQVIHAIRDQVVKLARSVDHDQTPGYYSEFTGEFYFVPPESNIVSPLPRPRPAPAPLPTPTPAPINSEPSAAVRLWRWLWNADAPSEPMVSGARVTALLNTLGIDAQGFDASHSYPLASVRELIEGAPRRATLGSTPAQMQAAFELCRKFSKDCRSNWYDDETLRSVVLKPFELDEQAVSVREFREFADGTHYRTEAEQRGGASVLVGVHLEQVRGGTWRNALKRHPIDDDAPVVGVTYKDALHYCRYKGKTLPSEDQWEYVARGPSGAIFPWGNDPALMKRTLGRPPHVTDGPPEGIGGRYRGLAGNVWQWVDTKAPGNLAVLKGGSWLEPNPANDRAAAHLYEPPSVAEEVTGFRCAKQLSSWPDADLWLAQLR